MARKIEIHIFVFRENIKLWQFLPYLWQISKFFNYTKLLNIEERLEDYSDSLISIIWLIKNFYI